MSQRLYRQKVASPQTSSAPQCQDAKGARHYHWGHVSAVNTGPHSVDVLLDASGVAKPQIPYSDSITAPAPGHYVAVEHEGEIWFVTHRVA
jgi:hypothetical protein